MPDLGQIRRFVEPWDLEIWRMTLQNNRHLFYATSSFVHHFVRSRHCEKFGAFTGPKRDFGLILLILNMIIHKNYTGPTQFLPVNVPGPVSFAVSAYPLVNSNLSCSPEMPNLGQIRRFLEPCDLEIWRMTFKNNRVPLLCYFKLCAAFRSHWWIQTGVAVRKQPIWVKFDDF